METELREILEQAKKKTELKYDECPECEELAKELLVEYADLLGDAKEAQIKYLKKLSEKSNYLGKCTRTTGKWAYLTNYDYVIEVWDTFWGSATLQQKKALLLHELLHINKKVTEDGKVKWTLRKHDVEEFIEVVSEFGAWTPVLESFQAALISHRKKQEEENA